MKMLKHYLDDEIRKEAREDSEGSAKDVKIIPCESVQSAEKRMTSVWSHLIAVSGE